MVNVDSRRMNALLDTLDEQAGQPARNAGISLSGGQVELTEPRDGAQLDRDRAAAMLVDAYLHDRDSVRLPLRLVPPDVDGADLDTAVTTIANPAVSGPVTLTFADKQVVLEPRQYADLLSMVTEDGALALDVDPAGLAALVDPAAQEALPVDASVALTDGVPTDRAGQGRRDLRQRRRDRGVPAGRHRPGRRAHGRGHRHRERGDVHRRRTPRPSASPRRSRPTPCRCRPPPAPR